MNVQDSELYHDTLCVEVYVSLTSMGGYDKLAHSPPPRVCQIGTLGGGMPIWHTPPKTHRIRAFTQVVSWYSSETRTFISQLSKLHYECARFRPPPQCCAVRKRSGPDCFYWGLYANLAYSPWITQDQSLLHMWFHDTGLNLAHSEVNFQSWPKNVQDSDPFHTVLIFITMHCEKG
jgi:hypothetical protein